MTVALHLSALDDLVRLFGRRDSKLQRLRRLGKNVGPPPFDDYSHRHAVDAVLERYDFVQFETVVEIHGPRGMSLAHALERYPLLHYTAVCDPLERLPPGADAYVLSRAVRQWDDWRSLRILSSCRQAMGRRSRLLVLERLLPPQSALDSAAEGCRERTEAQYAALLAIAGLTIKDIIPTRSALHIIEARPA